MLELKSIQEIINGLIWIGSLGLSEVKGVKGDIEELISDLSRSLVSLWEIVKTITAIDEGEFTKEKFEDVYDYFVRFYLQDQNITKAITHCGNVKRTADRIKFKLGKVLYTDLGKWKEAEEQLEKIMYGDNNFLFEYNASISKIDLGLQEIKSLLEGGNVDSSKQKYFGLKEAMESDIRQLKNGVNVMEQAFNHINQIVG